MKFSSQLVQFFKRVESLQGSDTTFLPYHNFINRVLHFASKLSFLFSGNPSGDIPEKFLIAAAKEDNVESLLLALEQRPDLVVRVRNSVCAPWHQTICVCM